MAEGGHTDETLLEEVQAIYDAGFRGIELCQLNVSGMDETVWAYGSEQWNHDFHLVLNKALDLGMTVGITSGTHWSTTNIPGLDPNSQSAMQAAYETNEQVEAGATRTGPIPLSKTSSGGCGGSSTTHVGENAQFLGAYAYKVIRSNNLDANILDLSDLIVVEEDGTRTLTWPGFEADDMKSLGLHALGTRNPDYADYYEMNQHMGRIQALLREGNSRTDVGMIYEKYGQPTNNLCSGSDDMWMQRHDWMFFPSMELQENGYTYDYFSPEFLNSDKVYYDAENGRLEQAGYKAIVLWQNWLDLNGAENLLKLAKEGLKVVVVDGAATRTPHNDGAEAQAALDAIMTELKALGNVATAATADDVLEALQALDVAPYAGFENQQIVTQVRGDEDGNLYLYAWNYCDGSIHEKDDVDHGLIANTDITMDGTFIPYAIDAWSGEITQLAEYRWEDGKTIFPIELAYSDVALYAFEAVEAEPDHLIDAAGLESYVTEDGMILRATETGVYTAATQFGNEVRFQADVPATPTAVANVTVTGNTDATLEDDLVCSINVGNVKALATAALTVEVSAEPEVELAEGWTALFNNYENGILSLVIFNKAGVTAQDPASVVTLTIPATGEVCDMTVAVTEAVLSAYVGEAEAFLNASLDAASLTIAVDYSIYDVNEDGTVNQLDITRAQRLYGQKTTEKADVDKDGEVTIEDLILILNNYSK